MEELHTEGLATHSDPESCVASCEGRGEALTGARAGRAIEPRNQFSGVPTPSGRWKATLLAALSRAVSGRRAVAEPGHGTSMRENREIWCLPAGLISGRDAQGTPWR
jgi:RNA-directed DNA polymerase